MLWDVHRGRALSLDAARTALKHLQFTDAASQLEHAGSILHDERTLQVRAVLNLLRGDFAGALGCYRALFDEDRDVTR